MYCFIRGGGLLRYGVTGEVSHRFVNNRVRLRCRIILSGSQAGAFAIGRGSLFGSEVKYANTCYEHNNRLSGLSASRECKSVLFGSVAM